MKTLTAVIISGWFAMYAQENPNLVPLPDAAKGIGPMSLFAAAIGVQYWENRKKDKEIRELTEKQATQNERIINQNDRVMDLLEKLEEKFDSRFPG